MKKMSVEGNLGAQSASEMSKAFPRPIKKSGSIPSNPLTYRKPKIEGGQGPHAV